MIAFILQIILLEKCWKLKPASFMEKTDIFLMSLCQSSQFWHKRSCGCVVMSLGWTGLNAWGLLDIATWAGGKHGLYKKKYRQYQGCVGSRRVGSYGIGGCFACEISVGRDRWRNWLLKWVWPYCNSPVSCCMAHCFYIMSIGLRWSGIIIMGGLETFVMIIMDPVILIITHSIL